MAMLERELLSTPVYQWVVDQVIVFDYYDGPRGGVCALVKPAVEFVFECQDEQHHPDGLDMRIMRVRALPPKSVARLASGLNALGAGSVHRPIWCPVWTFPSAELRGRADELVKDVEAAATVTDVLIATTDMVSFSACWKSGTPGPVGSAIPPVGAPASVPAEKLE
jgi:hypothetical protein